MSEFKIIGDYYVSEWNGSSANPGTATSPYAHPADSALNVALIIGAGYYKGGVMIGGSGFNYAGDGKVIIDCLGATLYNTGGSSGNKIASGLHIKNCAVFGHASNGGTNSFTDLILENVNVFAYRSASGNVIQGITFLPNSSGLVKVASPLTSISNTVEYKNCIFLENIAGAASGEVSVTQPFAIRVVRYCFLSAGKKLLFEGTSALLENNMLNGIITISGVDYELKKLKNGSTRPDSNPLIPDLATASGFSDTYTRGNFAGDPLIIDAVNRICSPESDLLKSTNGRHIGSFTAGKRIAVNSSDPGISITSTDIDTTDPLNWIIQSSATEGFINITWKISDTITEVQRIFLDALLSFDGSEAGGSTGNNNVPDNFPTSYSTLSAAGLKPNRLIYELRTSQSIGMPTVDSQWDNDSVALGTTAGNFYLQEWNTKPTIATVLGVPYGNGNPAGIGGATNGINARWGNAKIRLTNNRAY